MVYPFVASVLLWLILLSRHLRGDKLIQSLDEDSLKGFFYKLWSNEKVLLSLICTICSTLQAWGTRCPATESGAGGSSWWRNCDQILSRNLCCLQPRQWKLKKWRRFRPRKGRLQHKLAAWRFDPRPSMVMIRLANLSLRTVPKPLSRRRFARRCEEPGERSHSTRNSTQMRCVTLRGGQAMANSSEVIIHSIYAYVYIYIPSYLMEII